MIKSKNTKVYFSIVIDCLIIISTIVALNLCYYETTSKGASGGEMFRYFTILSNIYLSLTVLIDLPYSIYTIKNREYKIPKWLTLLKHSGLVMTTITFLTVCSFLGIVYGFASMLSGSNLFMHLTTPILAIVYFILFYDEYNFKFKESLFSITPFLIYLIVYFIEVVIIKSENGGWPDLYGLNLVHTWPLTITIFIAVAIGIDYGYLKLNKLIYKNK